MPRMLKPCTSSDKMLSAFLVLLVCELAGDLLRQVLALPVPGPVIGMTILAAALVFKRKTPTSNSVIVRLEQTSEALIRHMGGSILRQPSSSIFCLGRRRSRLPFRWREVPGT